MLLALACNEYFLDILVGFYEGIYHTATMHTPKKLAHGSVMELGWCGLRHCGADCANLHLSRLAGRTLPLNGPAGCIPVDCWPLVGRWLSFWVGGHGGSTPVAG